MLDYIYRFKRCNNYAFDELFKNQITFVCLSKFNDAMEGYILFDPDKVYETFKKKNYKSLFSKLIKAEEKKIVFGKGNAFNLLSKKEKEEYVRSEKYKPQAIEYIKEFGSKLLNELRNSFCAASFTEKGGHPVMWSHYSDDSSGFCVAYDFSTLILDFRAYTSNEFYYFNNRQIKLFDLHKITYGNPRDCTKLIIDFIKKAYRPGKSLVNKFIKYAEKDNNIDIIINVLTNKMKEWEYESEYRLLLPRRMNGKKISKEEAYEFSNGIINISFAKPLFIIAGENISKNNLAALAFYANLKLNGFNNLKLQKRDDNIIKKHTMTCSDFKPNLLIK